MKKGFSHLAFSLVTQTIVQDAYKHNNFILFLIDVFGRSKTLEAAQRYKIGTANHWYGATVFWQIDSNHRVRTGKIMLYGRDNCKRVKQPFNHIAWVHKIVGSGQMVVGGLKLDNCKLKSAGRTPPTANYTLQQCFFGEHLVAENPGAVIAITESEKTAVMASIMMPQFVWLAAGSLHGLQPDKCRVLQNRQVVLFPDVGAYSLWADCARTLSLKIPTAIVNVHTEMEQTATPNERTAGADMADRWIAEWHGMTAGAEL